jgi:phasin family protein
MADKKSAKPAAKSASATVLEASKSASKGAASPFAAFQGLPSNDFFKEIPNMFQPNKQFDKLTQDAAVIGQDQMDAIAKSTAIFQKGVQDIINVASQIAQEAGEKNAAATKALLSCKTLNEFADAQSKLAQSSYDQFLSNATKLSEMSVKVCTDTFAPINDQTAKAIKKATDSVAA